MATPFPTIVDLRDAVQNNLHAVEMNFWSKGLPALDRPVRPLRDVTPVEEMTIAQLRDSQDDEIVPISSDAYQATGQGVLSLDAAASFDDAEEGTLLETIGDDHWLRQEFSELFERAMDGDKDAIEEAREVYALWLDDEAMASRYGVAKADYSSIDPAIRQRIEWERYIARCSGTQTHEGFKISPKQVTFFSWPATDRKSFLERKASFIQRFMERYGLSQMPTVQQFNVRRAKVRAAARDRNAIEARRRLNDALLDFAEEEHYAFDDDFGTSAEVLDYPYVPSLALITYQFMQPTLRKNRETRDWSRWPEQKALLRQRAVEHWQELVAEAGEPVKAHRCRNAVKHRDHRDETWHATLIEEEIDPPAVTFGLDFVGPAFAED